jgi:hypothetical protein
MVVPWAKWARSASLAVIGPPAACWRGRLPFTVLTLVRHLGDLSFPIDNLLLSSSYYRFLITTSIHCISTFIVRASQVAIVTMKNTLVIAAAALLGAADAGMHRMKLQKVPLSEQLVS